MSWGKGQSDPNLVIENGDALSFASQAIGRTSIRTVKGSSPLLSLGQGAAARSTTVKYVTRRKEQWRAAFLAANQSQKRQESFQVLFPSPQFVVPLAFPAIMFGVRKDWESRGLDSY